MRLLWIIHQYPPVHNAGAETMAHQINRWLLGRGHTVTVHTRDVAHRWEGIDVRRRGPLRWMVREAKEADVVITHLDETKIAEGVALQAGKPLVHVLHNDRQLTYHGVTKADLLVANTAWLRDTIPARLAGVTTVTVHPPTFTSDYTTDGPDRTAITLINLLEAKGGALFYRLAGRLPDRRFLAVTGAYGPQLKPPPLPNLTVRPNRPDMVPVWEQTRLLLAPSSYESFGKAAVEALASGIPVIAHPTSGLLESLGGAGIFEDRDDDDAWVASIGDLDDPAVYASASAAARRRAEELEAVTVRQLEELERALEELR